MFRRMLILCAALMMFAGCQSPATSNSGQEITALGSSSPPVSPESNTATMIVHGMACPQCAYNVDLQLLKVPGVTKVREVNMRTGRVVVEVDPANKPSREALQRAISQTGFTLVSLQM